ncbi:MAG: adenosine kinase [alpha proteobacterium HIMB114]|nr:MAG: adenosine kinase [alpha proteobacterium HIMB114]|tara:strand:+ start:709 stop:1638 length:930 start_codon:yes stop_codon:yes gene_type:complete
MKVLGIGNAIVDVLCKVDDQFIKDHALTKGTMKLVDEQEFKRLLSNLKIESTVSGGSVANSIVGMSQLGDDVSFIGKVNDDDFGHKYIDGLKKENVDYFYNVKKVNIPTGTCLILITPDSERTMCTFLGIAGQIDDNDIDANAIQSAEITFLEGYLWDEGGPTKAFEKALSATKKSAMSLSDPFCVDRHKESFLNLVKNKLDIIFANEKEAMSLIDAKNFDEVVDFGKSLNKLFIVTRSDKGSVAIEGNDVSEAQAKSNLNIVDLTGAGDLFAAGFLHGFTNNKNPHESLKLGTEMASKIIQKIGARLD